MSPRIKCGATYPSKSFSERGVGSESAMLNMRLYVILAADMGYAIPPDFPYSNVIVEPYPILKNSLQEGALNDEMALIRAVGEGRSKVPINKEYILTLELSTGGLELFTKGMVESKDALDSFRE